MEKKLSGMVGDFDWKIVRDVINFELSKCKNELEFLDVIDKIYFSIGTEKELEQKRKKLKIHDFKSKDKKKFNKPK